MKVKSQGGYKYSLDVEEEIGRMPIAIAGVTYLILIAKVLAKNLFFDPDNERLAFADVDGGLSQSGQKKLKQALTSSSPKLEAAASRLRKSMEYHKGQNEFLWVRCNKDGKPIVVEGNRRLAEGQWDSVIVCVYPDDIEDSHMKQHIAQRHVAGIQEWDSACRSKVAYDFLTSGMSLEDVTAQLQFDNKAQTKKYIDSYVLWSEAKKLSDKIQVEDWSKFNHACSPIFKMLFGYDDKHLEDNSAPFKDHLRHPKKKKQLPVEEIDLRVARAASKFKFINQGEATAFRANFPWFVKLIEDGHLTACLQSDAIGSILRNCENRHALKALEILHSKPKQNGKSPAELAKSAWEKNNRESKFPNKVDKMCVDVNEIIESDKIEEYQVDNEDNALLRLNAERLQKLLGKFIAQIPS